MIVSDRETHLPWMIRSTARGWVDGLGRSSVVVGAVWFGDDEQQALRGEGGYVVPTVPGCRGPAGCSPADLGAPTRETVKVRATEKLGSGPARAGGPGNDHVLRGGGQDLSPPRRLFLATPRPYVRLRVDMIDRSRAAADRAWSTTATGRARAWCTVSLSVARNSTVSLPAPQGEQGEHPAGARQPGTGGTT